MSTETQKVDVLAVMDQSISDPDDADTTDMVLARAAVAELIESAKEASGWVDQVSVAGCAAIDRLAAALARVGGAA